MTKDLRGGFPTYWQTYGSGSAPALLLHCSLASSRSFAEMAKELSRVLTMTAFDMPGHGQSDPWDYRGDLHSQIVAMASDLACGPTHIIGHSFGAVTALRLALEAPALVRSLTLIEPVLLAAGATLDASILEDYRADMTEISRKVQAGDAEGAARGFVETWGEGTAWDDLPADTRKKMRDRIHLVPLAMGVLVDDSAGLLEPGRLDDIAVPVLLMQGSDTPRAISLNIEVLTARIPDATRVVIGGAGHMAPVTHPRQVAFEILHLLRRS